MKTTKKIISLVLCLIIAFSSLSVIAYAASYDDIESIEVYATRDLIEGYDGYITQERVNESEDINESEFEEYFYYEIWRAQPYFIINFTDGTGIEGDIDAIKTYFNYNIYESYGYSQTFNNQWKAGNSYTVYVYLESFMGNSVAQGSFDVNVVESPVASVAVNEISLIENLNGWWDTIYNENTDEYEQYFCYNLPTLQYTVTFKDGTEIISSDGYFEYLGNWYSIYIDQYTTPLKPGRNEVEFSLLGYNGKVVINVESSPVESVTFEEITLIENLNGYFTQRYNSDTGSYEDFYHYNLPTLQYTVTFKDGTEIFVSDGNFEYLGNWYSIYIDQYTTPLKPGRNEVEFSFLGYDGKVVINVEGSPVESVTFEEITLIENLNGYFAQRYNSDTGSYEDFYHYNLPIFQYTVTFKDGTEIISSDGYFEYLGNWYSIYIEQHATPLKPGRNEIEFSLLGYNGKVVINVEKTPIESISVKNSITKTENADGYWTTRYNSDTGSYEEYFCYYLPVPEYTVKFKDGTVLDLVDGGIEYNGNYYPIEIDQAKTPLKLGENNVPFSVLGYEGTVKINILESPIESIIVKNMTVIENADGHFSYMYNPDTGNYEDVFIYSLPSYEFSILFNDGTKIDSEDGYLDYNGEYYRIYAEEQYGKPLKLGENIRVFTAGGYKGTFTITVKENPVENVIVEPLYLVENTYGEYTGGYNNYAFAQEEPVGDIAEDPVYYAAEEPANYPVGETTIISEPTTYIPSTEPAYPEYSTYPPEEMTTNPGGGTVIPDNYFRYNLDRGLFSYTVELKDGTVLKSLNGRIRYEGQDYYVKVQDNQDENHLTLGANTIDVSVLGYNTTATVNIIQSPVKEITASPVRIPLSEGEFLEYSGEVWYDISDKVFCDIELTDGTEIRLNLSLREYSHCGGFEYLNKQYFLETPSYGLSLEVGINEIPVSFMGKTINVSVEVYDDILSPFRYDEVYGGVVITEYAGPDTDTLEVPAQINGMPVIGIAYLGSRQVTTLIIPDSVKHLSKGWLSVYGLKNLYLGSGISEFDINEIDEQLEYIEISSENETFCSIDGVLYSKDKTIVVAYPPAKGAIYKVPDFVSNIDIFYGSDMYNSLYRNVELEFSPNSSQFVTVDDVTYSADMKRVLWCDPEKTGNYIMPDSVVEIAEKAFEGSSLEAVSISPNVTEIVYATFANCSSLVSIEMPESVKSIGRQSFVSCTSLESIDLSHITFLGESSFGGCSALNNIELSEELTETAGSVFASCTSLEEISIPSSLRIISGGMFADCTALKKVNISEGIEIISYSAFAGSGITVIDMPDSIFKIYPNAFAECEQLTKAVVDADIKVIPRDCFRNCSNLQEIIIGDNVTHIEKDAFKGCYSLAKITIPDNLIGIDTSLSETAYCNQAGNKENGLVYLNDILLSADSSVSGKVKIKDGTRMIANDVFSGNMEITEVTFPDSLRIIGNCAFSDCSTLTKAELPEGLEIIGVEAFSGTAIEKVTIPATVTDIVYRSFASSPVIEIDMPENAVNLGGRNFEDTVWYSQQPDGLVYLENVLYDSKGFIATPTEITVADGINSIAGHAFEYETNLTAITLPDNVEIIGEHAFAGCLSLSDITLSSSLKIIDDEAFINTSLDEIILPEGIEVFGYRVFAGTNITSVDIPASVRLMSQFTFAGCRSLESINVHKDNPYFSSIDGVLYNKDGTKVIFCPEGKKGTVTLSEKVTEAENLSFSKTQAQMIVVKNPEFKIDVQVFNTSIKSERFIYSDSYYGSHIYFDYSLIALPWATGPEIFNCYNPVTICAPVGSTAHKYAIAHGHPFEVYVPEDVHEHSYSETVTVQPGCETDGESIFKCTCGDSYKNTLPAIGHSFGEWTAQANIKSRTCLVCGYLEKIIETDGGNVEIEAPEQPDADFEVEDVFEDDGRYILAENSVDEKDKILKVFDISLKNYDGVHVQPDGTVKVKLPLDWEKDGNYKVYRVNDDGTLTDMNAVRQGSHMLFETDHFSIYVIVEVDANAAEEENTSCRHICHKDGFFGFLWKIINFFQKLFGISPVCECGMAHY